MSKVRNAALYFIAMGLLAVVASLAFVVYEQNSVWAREGVDAEAEVTGINSLLSSEVDVTYVDELGSRHDGVVTVAKSQLSRQYVQVQYLRSDPTQVRSTKNPYGLVVAALFFAVPMIVLGAIGYWGSKKYPDLADEGDPLATYP